MTNWRVSASISIFSAVLGAVLGAALSPGAQQTVNILNDSGQQVMVKPSVAGEEYQKLFRQFIEISEKYEHQKRQLTDLATDIEKCRLSLKSNTLESSTSTVDEVMASVQKQYAGDYLFVLKGCEARGEQLNCTLTVEDQKNNSQLRLAGNSTIGGPSRAVDQEGREYIPARVALGATWNSSWIINQTKRNVPMQIQLQFAEVPESVNKLAMLDVATSAGSAVFRDVKIKK